uniref:HNH endonuclease n=1 Tax=Trichocoleus desertorum TaxID=1481672 RepID=UPI0025B4B1FD|nr:HNH endonuclease [Trichocoleus desertorum]
MKAPYKCLFCFRADASFEKIEHPIPESLGNDDWILPKGFVCDECNQYFGSKVENRVISEPPFILERLGYVIKSKKGRLPKYEARKGLHLISSGFTDTLLFVAEEECVEHYHNVLRRKPFLVYQSEKAASHIARFLLKVGLEAMINSGINPYDSKFDAARDHARRGKFGNRWQVGYGVYLGGGQTYPEARAVKPSSLSTVKVIDSTFVAS